MIRVVVADDQELVRSGFGMVLGAQPDIEVVGEASSGGDAVRACGELLPDVVLMDVRMPGMDGIEATRLVVTRSPSVRVLVLTTFDLDQYVHAALRAGASGFLLKSVSPSRLVEGVRTVMAGEALLDPLLLRRMVQTYARRPAPADGTRPARLADLTDREVDVLRSVARGRSNAEVARELFITPSTVKTHVNRVLTKLGLRDRVQAVVLAYECGLVEPGD